MRDWQNAGAGVDGRLFALYARMYLIRAAERAIQAHYAEDQMTTPMHMSMGAEAIAVGVCAALRPEDQVVCSYRSHAVYLARTGDIEGFFRELYGRPDAPSGGRAGSMHLALPDGGHMVSAGVVASQVPMALGLAYAHKVAGNGCVAVAFFGDGALDAGVLWESMNIAHVHKLPVLFVCEDNGLAVETPKAARWGFALDGAVKAFLPMTVLGREGGLASGGNVASVESAAQYLLAQVRANGPAFLRVRYERLLEHVGVSDAYPGRPSAAQIQDSDPLLWTRRGVAREIGEDALRAEEAAIVAAVDQARAEAAIPLWEVAL